MRCILKNAKVFSQGVFHLADVFLSDGKIVSIGNGVFRPDDNRRIMIPFECREALKHSLVFNDFTFDACQALAVFKWHCPDHKRLFWRTRTAGEREAKQHRDERPHGRRLAAAT